jgi:hypothetical protein
MRAVPDLVVTLERLAEAQQEAAAAARREAAAEREAKRTAQKLAEERLAAEKDKHSMELQLRDAREREENYVRQIKERNYHILLLAHRLNMRGIIGEPWCPSGA